MIEHLFEQRERYTSPPTMQEGPRECVEKDVRTAQEEPSSQVSER
jgi:hypothetical protein